MISQTDRSLNALHEEIHELKSTINDIKKSSYALVRVTFILLISVIIGMVWT
jgi:prefoldin subunit 5